MSDNEGATRSVPVKVGVEAKVEVKRNPADDGIEGREGEVGGKRRNAEDGDVV
jgi:hypothetical protein